MGSGLPVVTNKVRLLTPAIAWANPDIAKHKRLNNIPVTTNCPDSSVRNKAKRFVMSCRSTTTYKIKNYSSMWQTLNFSLFFEKRLIFHRNFYLQVGALSFAERFQREPICNVQLFRLFLWRILYGNTIGGTTVFEDIPCKAESVWHFVQRRPGEEPASFVRFGYHTRIQGWDHQESGSHRLFGRSDRQWTGEEYGNVGVWQRRQTERGLHQDQFGIPEPIRHLYIISFGGTWNEVSL